MFFYFFSVTNGKKDYFRAEGGGRTRAKSGEVEGGGRTLGGPRRAMAEGGGRTERSFYFVLVPPQKR